MLSHFSRVWLFANLWIVVLQVPAGSSVCGILQARTLGWAPMPSSRGSSQPGDWTCVSHMSCIAGEGIGYPLQDSGLEKSMDCLVHQVVKSWTRLSDCLTHTHTHYCIGSCVSCITRLALLNLWRHAGNQSPSYVRDCNLLPRGHFTE